jgi:hypothetical protein
MKAVYYEAGQNLVSMTTLTDDGDHITFNSASQLWSNYPGRAPTVLPNGVISGGAVTPAVSGTDDAVDVSSLSCNLNGVQKVGATKIAADTDITITREVTNAYLKASIVVTNAGAFDVIEGTAHASAFSDTRGADGGPPYIPVDNIEVAQVHLTSTTSAAITTDEIKDVPNVHTELATLPNYIVKFIRVDNQVLQYAGVDFTSALSLIHTGDVAKRVYAEHYTPLFASLQNTRNFDPPRVSGSVSSEAFYDETRSSVSESIGAGSLEFAPTDEVADPFLTQMTYPIWFKYYPDDLKAPYFATLASPYDSGASPADGLTIYTVSLVGEISAERVIA